MYSSIKGQILLSFPYDIPVHLCCPVLVHTHTGNIIICVKAELKCVEDKHKNKNNRFLGIACLQVERNALVSEDGSDAV